MNSFITVNLFGTSNLVFFFKRKYNFVTLYNLTVKKEKNFNGVWFSTTKNLILRKSITFEFKLGKCVLYILFDMEYFFLDVGPTHITCLMRYLTFAFYLINSTCSVPYQSSNKNESKKGFWIIWIRTFRSNDGRLTSLSFFFFLKLFSFFDFYSI